MELKNLFAQDREGNILAGAWVYLYEEGSTVPVADIRDKNGTPLTNPFQSDGQGLIQFAAPNGRYDLRVRSGLRDYTITVQCMDVKGEPLTFYAPDRPAAEILAAELGDGATVWIDSDAANGGVRTRNSVASGALTSPVSDTAEMALFTQAGSGAVGRTVQEKMRDFVSVKDFGAVGDGVADDTAAVQAAFNAARKVSLSGLKLRITNGLNITAGDSFTLDGEGGELFADTYSLRLINLAGNSTVTHKNVVIENVRFTMTASGGNTNDGLISADGPNVSSLTVRKCRFTAPSRGVNGFFFKCRGEAVSDDSRLDNLLIEGCDFVSLGRMGIEIINNNVTTIRRYKNIRIINNTFDTTGIVANGMGISLSGLGESSVIEGNNFNNCPFAGIELAGAGRGIVVNGNTFAGDLKPLSCSQSEMTGVVISNNSCSGYVSQKVLLGSLRGASIRGNSWMTNDTVEMPNGGGNVFADNIVMAKGVYAMIVDNSPNNLIRDNILDNTGAASNFSTLRFVNAGAAGNLAQRNMIYKGPGGALSDEALGATGNRFEDTRTSLTQRDAIQQLQKRAGGGGAISFTINFGEPSTRTPQVVEVFAASRNGGGGGGTNGYAQSTFFVSALNGTTTEELFRADPVTAVGVAISATYGNNSMTITVTQPAGQNGVALVRMAALTTSTLT